MTLDLTRCPAPTGLLPPAALLLAVLWAFRTSLGGRSLLQDEFAEG